MKLRKLFLPVLILSLLFSGSLIQAQEKKSEKEKEQKIRELEQKLEKALQKQEVELEKALKESKMLKDEELKKVFEQQRKVQEKAMDHYRKAWKENGDANTYNWSKQMRFYDSKNYEDLLKDGKFKVIEPDMEFDFDWDEGDLKGLSGAFIMSSKERTALTIKKELDDITFDTKFKYEVTKGASGLNFKVEGEMAEGTLLIRLHKPNGEVLQEIEISPLADISWNQDLRWDTDEDKDKNLGTWIIVVSAKNASGKYNVNVREN